MRKHVPHWEVMHYKLVENYPHYQRAGLQLADVVASSFYQAVDNLDTGPCDIQFATALKPRVAFNDLGQRHDYGLVLQPTPCWKAEIGGDQKKIFEFYGYDFNKPVWAR